MSTVVVANKADLAVKVGEQIVVGMAYARANKPADGTDGDFPIVGGYALTSGIDAEAWREWLERNRDSDIVKRSMILAHPNVNVVKSQIRGVTGTKAGPIPHNWAAGRAKP